MKADQGMVTLREILFSAGEKGFCAGNVLLWRLTGIKSLFEAGRGQDSVNPLQLQIRHTGVPGAARFALRVRRGSWSHLKPIQFRPGRLAPIHVQPSREQGVRIVCPVLQIRKGRFFPLVGAGQIFRHGQGAPAHAGQGGSPSVRFVAPVRCGRSIRSGRSGRLGRSGHSGRQEDKRSIGAIRPDVSGREGRRAGPGRIRRIERTKRTDRFRRGGKNNRSGRNGRIRQGRSKATLQRLKPRAGRGKLFAHGLHHFFLPAQKAEKHEGQASKQHDDKREQQHVLPLPFRRAFT